MKSKIIAITTFLILAFSTQTFFSPNAKIKPIEKKEYEKLELVDNDPELNLTKNKLLILEGENVDLLDFIVAKDDYDDVKVKVNIKDTSSLVRGFYDVVYETHDRKNNKVIKKAILEVLDPTSDYDLDGYSNIEEKNAASNYDDKFSIPNYDKAPTITITNLDSIIQLNSNYNISAYAYDVADGFLDVEIYTNINKNVVGSYYVIFRVFDSLMNQTTIRREVRVVDNRPLAFESINTSSDDWTNKDITIDYKFNKNISYVEYSFDNLNWQKEYSNSLKFTESMNKVLYLRGVDLEGRKSETKTLNLKIDKEMPTFEDFTTVVEASKNSQFSCDEVLVNSLSGIKDMTVINNVELNKVGKYSCTYTLENNAGTIASKEVIVEVEDTTAPTILNTNIKMTKDEFLEEKLGIDDNSLNNLTINIEDFDKNSLGEKEVNISISDEYGNELKTKVIVNIDELETINIKDIRGDIETITKYKTDEIEFVNTTINGIELINDSITKTEEANYDREYKVNVTVNEDNQDIQIDITEDILEIIENNINVDNIEIEVNGTQLSLNYTSGLGFSLK